jgi:RNA polymerase sigma factor (TIGR02999 family)
LRLNREAFYVGRHRAEAGMAQGLDLDDLGVELADQRALDDLFSAAYEELRGLASSVRRRDARASISPTALVNEAWVKLSKSPPSGTVSHLHFKRIAARAMRQVLVEAARRRNASKRGGGSLAITLDESMPSCATSEDILALDASLRDLARISPRQAAMIEARFFGGMDVAETAEILKVSEATVLRDWRAARAWLAQELAGPG